jgi:hypothetical protein
MSGADVAWEEARDGARKRPAAAAALDVADAPSEAAAAAAAAEASSPLPPSLGGNAGAGATGATGPAEATAGTGAEAGERAPPLKRSASSQSGESAPRVRGPSRPPSRLVVRDVVRFLKSDPQSQNVAVEQPREVACMSRTVDLEWLYGDRRAYGEFNASAAKAPIDLSVGFEDFQRTWRAPTPDSLIHVLRALKRGEAAVSRPRVVAWRGILTKLMTTPFFPRDTFQLVAWKHKGVVYLSNRETEDKRREDANMPLQLKRFMYFGYKLEEVLTREPGQAARAVDPRECFCRIFKTRIGSTSVLAAGEMDCRDSQRGADIELKVSRVIESDVNQLHFDKFKLIKYYCQSFLAGVPYIVVGFRDNWGVVQEFKTFETLKIPRIVRGREEELWDPHLCLQFLDYCLKWLQAWLPDGTTEDVNREPCFLISYDGAGVFHAQQCERTAEELMDESLCL